MALRQISSDIPRADRSGVLRQVQVSVNLQAASASSALRLPSCSATLLTAGRPASRRRYSQPAREVRRRTAVHPTACLPEDPLHHRRRPTPMGTGQCSQHRTGVSAAVARSAGSRCRIGDAVDGRRHPARRRYQWLSVPL